MTPIGDEGEINLDYDVESGGLEMDAEGDDNEDGEADGLEDLMDPDPDGVIRKSALVSNPALNWLAISRSR